MTKATQQQRDQYEFNKLMISFDKIPEYIMNNIISTFHTHTSSNCEACKHICSTSL